MSESGAARLGGDYHGALLVLGAATTLVGSFGLLRLTNFYERSMLPRWGQRWARAASCLPR